MNSWQVSQLKFAFGIGSLMSFYGIVGFIVMMMPAGMMGNNTKVVTIILILLTLPFTLLLTWFVSRRGKKKAEKEAAAAEAAKEAGAADGSVAPTNGAKASAPTGQYPSIAQSAEETVQFLKSSNLGETGRDAVYSLPWYIVAGGPRSGKSSLVISSNLNFQPLPSQRQSELRFIRPTPAVDWRVTSDAVFVDTAGRYQTEGVDGDEWASLVDTIKKYRSNRPLDGFVLVVNAETIVKGDEREIEELAKVLRARLDDAIQRVKVKFPVYLVFTHADSIEGFRDSFSSSKNEDKTLVWGATIPIEKSDNAQGLFDSEYEILQDSVMKRRLVRLSAPFPPVRQLKIFNFPLHFGSARRKFGAFVNALFRPNPFSENPFLRGFYFTASPAGKGSANAPVSVANGYFSERLFRDVVLRDKDMVKTFVAQRQRPPIFGWIVTILGALIVGLLLLLAGVSLATNRQLLNDAAARGEKLLAMRKADAGKDILAKNEDETRREIVVTDELRSLMTQLDDYDRNGAPFYMRFGMYSGSAIYTRSLLPLYFSVVEQRFKAPALKRVEADLRKFADSQPVANPSQLTQKEEETLGKYYDLLKAYLMLSGEYQNKAEATQISEALKDYWIADSKVPGDMKLVAQQNLEFWAKQADRRADNGNFPRISLNAKLVEDTRRKLQAFPAVYRYYSRKITEISKEVDDKVGPTTVESILARNGADNTIIEGRYVVPSAFTRPGFDSMKIAILEAELKLSEDDWVMGELGRKALAQSTDSAKLQERYYRDYADHWLKFVKAVDIKPYKTKADATNALQTFAQANSPMEILVKEIAKNTNLSAQPESPSWIDWIKSFFSKKKDTSTGGTPPETEFRALFTFVGTKENPNAAPVAKYRGILGQVYNDFNGVSENQYKKIAEEMADDKDPIKIRARETAVTNLLAGFNDTPSGQAAAAMIQRPIGNLKLLLGADAQGQMVKIWNEQLLPDAKEIEKGYPFTAGTTETDLAKLSAFLAPGEGKFSKFYDEKLSRYFEESNNQLKVKDTSELKFSDEFVTYLNNLMKLRKALYSSGATPKFAYEFSLQPPKDATVEMTIDGQPVKAEGTGTVNLEFPAQGTETGVLISLGGSSASAPATTSGANTASNSNTATTTTAGGPVKYPGSWGLFKFVEASKPQKLEGGVYQLSFTVGGKQVTATIKSKGENVFDKAIFEQVRVPQTFLK
ncbi:MAG: type VI secretion system membrane subunit TssM [Pyrinomonadaceae bacterium]